MEFRKINLEKSWNFVSDLKLYESNFLRATRAFQLPVVHAFVHFIVVQLLLFIRYFVPWKNGIFLE